MITYNELVDSVVEIRCALEKYFSLETAHPNTVFNGVASSGHCAAVAYTMYVVHGGKLVSTKINDVSHWFNRIEAKDGWYDVDLTGDQFGFKNVQVEQKDSLYPNTKVRQFEELDEETQERGLKLLMLLLTNDW